MRKSRQPIRWGMSVAIMAAIVVAFLLVGRAAAREDDLTPVERLYADQRVAARRAVFWLVTAHQNRDGGYTNFSAGANEAPSDVGGTLNAVLALAGAGYPADSPYSGRVSSPLRYLRTHPDEVAAYAEEDAGQAGLLILALAAAGEDPRAFGGQDFVSGLATRLAGDGSFGVPGAYKQSLAMLGLAAAGEPAPDAAVDYLLSLQADNGSWDDGFGTPNNPDGTALAIMALLAAGQPPDSDPVQAARDFLMASQVEAGGWEYGEGFGANANSTALVAQALSALGEDWYSSDSPWATNGVTPLQALLSYQGTSGAFQSDFGQGKFDDFTATWQGVLGLAGRPLPLPAYGEAIRRGLSCLDALQDPDTGQWEQFAGAGFDAGGTARAIQAIAAAGEDPRAERWTTDGGTDPIEALEAGASGYLAGGRGGRAGLLAQALAAAGEDASEFTGGDLPLQVSGYLSPTGEYDSTAFGIFDQAEAILGLLATDNPVAPEAIEFLRRAQTDGDWGTADANGQGLQVLGKLGLPSPAGTLAVLHASQTPEGGWGFQGTFSPSSTAEVVLGLGEAPQNPFGPEWSVVNNGRINNAADAVLALQTADGCWPSAFAEGPDPYSTVDAILLLSERPNWGAAATLAPRYGAGD